MGTVVTRDAGVPEGVLDALRPAAGGGVGVGVGGPDADDSSAAARGGVTATESIVVRVGDGVRVEAEAIGLGTELVLEQARPATRRKARTDALRSRSLGANLSGAYRSGSIEASNKTSSWY